MADVRADDTVAENSASSRSPVDDVEDVEASEASDALSPLYVNHGLLLLSDSALPLGSFAFSSGLESYLAHRGRPSSANVLSDFHRFLLMSLSSLASTSLPYVIAAHQRPQCLFALDDAYDASLSCAVARRASVAQGKALLAVWDRALLPSLRQAQLHSTAVATTDAIYRMLDDLRRQVTGSRSASQIPRAWTDHRPSAMAHWPPLWGAVTRLMGLPIQQAAYVFLLNHVKAIVSAAVRASLIGPYQGQAMLASMQVQEAIDAARKASWNVPVEDAAQTVPVLDLWIGRHELLYSRIFNS